MKPESSLAQMPPAVNDPFFQHLADANRIFCDQIRMADQKAAYIFTFVLALMVWSAESRKALNVEYLINASVPALVVSGILLSSLLTALCSTICAILPRSRPGTSVFYWGAWPEAGRRLREAREEAQFGFIEADLLQNTETLAAICRTKYWLVRIAFRALLIVVFAYITLLILPK